MTIQQQIEALKKEFETKIAELEKQLAEEKKNVVWKPKHKERVYMLHCDMPTPVFFNEESGTHQYAYDRGNIFKTEEEAEWEDMHRIVATELKHFVQENDPNPITEEDWENREIEKYFIRYDYQEKYIWVDDCFSSKNSNQIHASNEEVLKKAIEHIGEDRLKKYYFGVKE